MNKLKIVQLLPKYKTKNIINFFFDINVFYKIIIY